MMTNSFINLKSAEGISIEVPLESALMSLTIKEMFDTLGVGLEDNVITEVPLPNITTSTLNKIMEWCIKWKNTPQPTSEEIKSKIEATISPWDENYVKMELTDLYQIVEASNFLNIPGLYWLTTRAIAYMIKDKTPDQIRTMFNIENDWTSEDLQQIKVENKWLEPK